jgi:molybdenum cofactor cytidylyltransferase
MPAVGILILAAGGSRRLGAPKQLLRDSEGQSLIRRASLTALASICRPITVVLGASADVVAEEMSDLLLTTVHNPDWETGMASSLRTGLAAITADISLDAVIVMLCDQPGVSPELLDSLVVAYQNSGQTLVACEYNDILGVPALFGRELFTELNGLTGDEGARRIIKAYSGPIARVPFPEGQFDIDTAADLEALRIEAPQRKNASKRRHKIVELDSV